VLLLLLLLRSQSVLQWSGKNTGENEISLFSERRKEKNAVCCPDRLLLWGVKNRARREDSSSTGRRGHRGDIVVLNQFMWEASQEASPLNFAYIMHYTSRPKNAYVAFKLRRIHIKRALTRSLNSLPACVTERLLQHTVWPVRSQSVLYLRAQQFWGGNSIAPTEAKCSL